MADPEHRVCDAYGVWQESKWGWGVARQTFVVAADGTLARHYPKVSPAGHAAQVLADLLGG